jgi:UDP-N-acetylmuramoylalanine-D-glutamate ligase
MTNIYFIGIGGIGMSAIARYYNAKGYRVSGYDKTPSPLTHALESEGIDVHYTDDISYIPADVENTLVVYTPAIPKDMGELVHVQKHGYRVIKRSRMLGEIAQGQRCLRLRIQRPCLGIEGTEQAQTQNGQAQNRQYALFHRCSSFKDAFFTGANIT